MSRSGATIPWLRLESFSDGAVGEALQMLGSGSDAREEIVKCCNALKDQDIGYSDMAEDISTACDSLSRDCEQAKTT